MKINLDSGEIVRIVKALEHYHAYLRSRQRDDNGRYLRLAERLRRVASAAIVSRTVPAAGM
jgi:hypothetical protein